MAFIPVKYFLYFLGQKRSETKQTCKSASAKSNYEQ
jgi:hypothetical protein